MTFPAGRHQLVLPCAGLAQAYDPVVDWTLESVLSLTEKHHPGPKSGRAPLLTRERALSPARLDRLPPRFARPLDCQ